MIPLAKNEAQHRIKKNTRHEWKYSMCEPQDRWPNKIFNNKISFSLYPIQFGMVAEGDREREQKIVRKSITAV